MSDHNYDFGSTFNAIEEDLVSIPLIISDVCNCDCHSLWGLNAAHIVACCNKMFEDDE